MLGSIQIKLVIISGEIVLRSLAMIILQTGGAKETILILHRDP